MGQRRKPRKISQHNATRRRTDREESLSNARALKSSGDEALQRRDLHAAEDCLTKSLFLFVRNTGESEEICQVLQNLTMLFQLEAGWHYNDERVLEIARVCLDLAKSIPKRAQSHETLHFLQTAYSIYCKPPYGCQYDVCEVARKLTVLYHQGALRTCSCNHRDICAKEMASNATGFAVRASRFGNYHGAHHCLLLANSVLNALSAVDKEVDLFENLEQFISLYQRRRYSGSTCTCKNRIALPCQATEKVWTKILKKLSEENSWDTVRVLMEKRVSADNALSGAAKGMCATEVNIEGLLRELCDEELASWGLDLAVTLVRKGASVDTVRTKYDSNPTDVALKFGLRFGCFRLLDFLLKPPGDKASKRNFYGDTLLHLVVKAGMADTSVGMRAIALLLDRGVRPDIPDRNGKLPLEYLNPTDQVYNFLLKKQSQPVRRLLTKLPMYDWKGSQHEQERQITDCIGESHLDHFQGLPLASRTNPRADPCDMCWSGMISAKQLIRKGRCSMAMERLCAILSDKSHHSATHNSLSEEVIGYLGRDMGKLVQAGNPGIPPCVVQLPSDVFHRMVVKMATDHQWRLVASLISARRQLDPHNQTMAQALQVTSVINCEDLPAEIKSEIISVLLKNGASRKTSSSIAKNPIKMAVDRKEFRLIPALIQHGFSPVNIEMDSERPPLHMALELALEWDKGYFELFENLLELFDKDSQRYSYLDPSRVDEKGDTLIDVVANYRSSCHTEWAAYLMNQRGSNTKDHSIKNTAQLTDECKTTGKPSSQSTKYKTVIEDYINNLTSDLADGKTHPVPTESGKDSLHSARETCPRSVAASSVCDEVVGHDGSIVASAEMNVSGERVLEIDAGVFEGLEWEVECTVEVWKALKDKKFPLHLKQTAIKKIQQLCQGDWTDSLTKQVRNVSGNLKLFETKISKDARILWERAISFSTRLSHGEVSAARYYSEIIRLWDIVLDHDDLSNRIQQVDKSYKKSQECLRPANLSSIPELRPSPNSNVPKRFPQRFMRASTEHKANVTMCPPGHPEDKIYIIIKVYDFSSDVVRQILQETDAEIDFPFKPTDSEYDIINLPQNSPILLLGRSGTGKTVCLLHRLWHRYKAYRNDPLYRELRCHQKNPSKTTGLLNSSEILLIIDAYRFFHRHKVEDRKRIKKILVEKLWLDDLIKEKHHSIIVQIFSKKRVLHPRKLRCRKTLIFYRPDAGCFGVKRALRSLVVKYQTGLFPSVFDVLFVQSESAHCGILPARRSCLCTHKTRAAAKQLLSSSLECSAFMSTGSCSLPEESLGLHQVFVTKNAILRNEIRKKFQELRNGCNFNGPSDTNSSLPCKLQRVPSQMYPLFLNFRQVLLMLDSSLPGKPFFERSEGETLKADIDGWTDVDISLVGVSDAWPPGGVASGNSVERIPTMRKSGSRREVTYDVFVFELWQKIKKKSQFQPSLVWTEIFTFIKGSFQSVLSGVGFLTLDEYEKVGKKCAPNFTGNRSDVYEIFKAYEREKKRNGMFDECDLLLNIHRRLDKEKMFEWKVDEMYVDETQDFTPAELSLLIKLCENPNRMFLSGDTAQAIMRGISFRFIDLNSLFYQIQDGVKVPIYHLTDNYRSHQGILSLASSIVDLLVKFFPESVDVLDRDQGVFPGPLPILLELSSSKDLTALLTGNQHKTSDIEFGAHQAILVVDDAARENIPKELQTGLVLTIEESKGLEFDDILLYNFFKESTADKEWRVVTYFLEHFNQPEAIQASACRPLAFDGDKHRVLCSEFKRLYTAITRARVRLWIYDEDVEKRAPVFEYFKANSLVRTVISVENGFKDEEIFMQRSASTDWMRRGDDFMKRQWYYMAIKCYQKAGNREKENVATAHLAVQCARGLHSNPSKMREEFLKAAELYLVNSGMVAEAAQCLVHANESLLAARLYGKCGQMANAGQLYNLCGQNYYESWQLESQGLYKQAVKVLCETNSFDVAIDVVDRYNAKVKECLSAGKPVPVSLLENKPDHSTSELREKANTSPVKDKENCSFLPKAGERKNAVQEDNAAGEHNSIQRRHWAACKKMILDAMATCTEVRNKDGVSQELPQLVDYFNDVKDFSEASEVQLVLGQINQDVNMIEIARQMFGNLDSQPNEAGQVECSKAKLKRINLAQSSETCYKFASQDLACLFKVLRISHESSDDTEKRKAKLYKYLRYYGLEHDDQDGMLVYEPRQSPKCLSFLKGDSKEDRVKISMHRAQQKFHRYLLQLAGDWIVAIRSAVNDIQGEYGQCPEFFEGRPCNRLLECRQFHEPLTKKTFWTLFFCHLTLVHIDALVLNDCEFLRDARMTLGGLHPWDHGTSFRNLICFLFKWGAHWKLFATDTHFLNNVFDTLRDQGLVLLQAWQSRRLLYCEMGYTSTDTERCLWDLVVLSDVENTEFWIKNFKSRPQDKSCPSRAIVKDRNTFLSRFYVIVRAMYQSASDPLDSLKKFKQFWNSFLDHKDSKHIEQILFFMEFFLMVDFCLGAKHTGHHFVVPSSYMGVVNFVDKCFAEENPLVHIVKFSNTGNKNVQKNVTKNIACMVESLLGKRTGQETVKESLLQRAFVTKAISEGVVSGVADRFWVLCLTLVSNVSWLVPASCQDRILLSLHEIYECLPQEEWPPRLVSALSRTFRCRGQRDVVEALSMILRQQNQEELLVCRWVDGARDATQCLRVEPIQDHHLTGMSEKFPTDKWLGKEIEGPIEEADWGMRERFMEYLRCFWQKLL